MKKKLQLLIIRVKIFIIHKYYKNRLKNSKDLMKVSSLLTVLFIKEYDIIRGKQS